MSAQPRAPRPGLYDSRPLAAARVSLRRSQFGGLFAAPLREIASPMEECSNNHAVVAHPIEETIVLDEQFTERRLADLRNDPTALGEGRETGSHVERADEDTNRAG